MNMEGVCKKGIGWMALLFWAVLLTGCYERDNMKNQLVKTIDDFQLTDEKQVLIRLGVKGVGEKIYYLMEDSMDTKYYGYGIYVYEVVSKKNIKLIDNAFAKVGTFVSPDSSFVFFAIDFMASGYGGGSHWVYRVNPRKEKSVKFIDAGAGILLNEQGFQVSYDRLLNPEAKCNADRRYMYHDVYYDFHGRKIREGKEEYDENELMRRYEKGM